MLSLISEFLRLNKEKVTYEFNGDPRELSRKALLSIMGLQLPGNLLPAQISKSNLGLI